MQAALVQVQQRTSGQKRCPMDVVSRETKNATLHTLSICWYSLLEGWWMEVMMVRPPLARLRSVCNSFRAVVESRPEVGCGEARGAGSHMRRRLFMRGQSQAD